MKKRILIICNYFAPDNAIAAVRISKLAKYLKIEGYEVEVITEKKENDIGDEILRADTDDIKVFYAENSKLFLKIFDKYKKIIAPYKNKRFNNLENRRRVNPQTGNTEFYTFETAYPVIGSLDYVMGQLRQIDLCRSIKKKLKKDNSYDCIITSYGDSFSYFAGKIYHNYHKNIPWIFDIRDAICRYKFTPDYVKWIPQKYEKYIWKNADCIIGVSKGICRQVPKRYRKKTFCITNGFDVSDRKYINSAKKGSQNMIFSYTGSMYGGLQDLSVFFKAVRKMILDKRLDENKIEFHFAGNDSAYEIFKNQAEKYKLGSRCYSHGKLSRLESLELQQNSDILLLASYDYKNNTGGIITGKLLEYMSAGKPIVAIVTGDIENSEVKSIINKTNIGITYEESNAEADFERLTAYIEKQYSIFLNEARVDYHPNEKEIAKYDYRNICKRLIKIIGRI